MALERTSTAIAVHDRDAPLAVAAGCIRIDATHASCPLPSTAPTDVIAELGDGDDFAALADLQPAGTIRVRGGGGSDRLSTTTVNGATLEGGDGRDSLSGGPGHDSLVGGTQSDELSGGPGNDYLIGEDASPGGAPVVTATDALDGGAGNDTASYSGHSAPLTVDLTITGRQPGARDDLLAGIENVHSAGAGDRLLGDDGPNTLRASGPRSTAIGRGGDDNLASEVADGGDGDDVLDVFQDTKRFTCGAGRDHVGLTRPRQLIPRDCELVAPTGLLNVVARPRRVGGRWLELRLATLGARRLDIRVFHARRGTLLASGPISLRRAGRLDDQPARLARLRLTRAGRRALAPGGTPPFASPCDVTANPTPWEATATRSSSEPQPSLPARETRWQAGVKRWCPARHDGEGRGRSSGCDLRVLPDARRQPRRHAAVTRGAPQPEVSLALPNVTSE